MDTPTLWLPAATTGIGCNRQLRLQGLVFDYFVDDKTGNMIAWAGKVPAFVYAPGDFANLFVPTVEATRLIYLLNLLVSNKHHVMLVGSTGPLSP